MTPETHLAEVLAQYDESPEPRLAQIMQSLITHLHRFVVDVDLTRDEWFQWMTWLREAGDLTDDSRNEFILLSDTFGVSMLVEMLNHAAREGTTEPTVFGPFHVDGAPVREYGDSIVIDDMDAGEPLVVRGRVLDLAGEPIGGAVMDVWQTAPNGLYDIQDDSQTEMNLRGVFRTDQAGRYEFQTVRPVDYTIPADGPAGHLLFANGRHNWRPAHIHFVVSADDYTPVITHLFDKTSRYLDSDAVFGVRQSLVIDMSAGVAEYDFVLDRASST